MAIHTHIHTYKYIHVYKLNGHRDARLCESHNKPVGNKQLCPLAGTVHNIKSKRAKVHSCHIGTARIATLPTVRLKGMSVRGGME
jgi:hypothetical protein